MKKSIKFAVAAAVSLFSAASFLAESCTYNISPVVSADSLITFSATDVVKLKQNILGSTALSEDEKRRFDVNTDGSVNIVDFSMIKNSYITNRELLVPDETPDSKPAPSVMKLDVDMIYQNPELPTGCEVTTLTMLLNYYGFNAEKTHLAKLMPRFNFVLIDKVLYGADFMTTFPGNPENNSGYGCFPPCMITTAEKYFSQTGNEDYYLKDISGADFDSLLSCVAAGKPVMVWATMNMAESYSGMSWVTPEGKKVTWRANEHCLLITGYDKNKGIVFVNDPLRGAVNYSISVFNLRYKEMGEYAAVLMKKDETLNIENPDNPLPSIVYAGDKVTYSGPVYYSSFGGKSVEVSGTFTVTEIIDDPSRPYRVRLGTAGWVPYDFIHS